MISDGSVGVAHARSSMRNSPAHSKGFYPEHALFLCATFLGSVVILCLFANEGDIRDFSSAGLTQNIQTKAPNAVATAGIDSKSSVENGFDKLSLSLYKTNFPQNQQGS